MEKHSLLVKIEKTIAEGIGKGSSELIFYGPGHLDKFPESLRQWDNLRKIVLSELSLEIPEWLADMPALEELTLSGVSGVAAFLPHIHKMKKLRVLDLGWSDLLDSLPDNFGLLASLEELTLSGAGFTTCPPCIGNLKKLHTLHFEFCECPPDNIFAVLSLLPELRKLHLTADEHLLHTDTDQPYDIPASLAGLSHLEELDLHSSADLGSLPEEIRELKHLRSLNIAQDGDRDRYGAIESLPNSLFSVPAFERLDIRDCRGIKQLPPSAKDWQTPKALLCVGSGLTAFPDFSPGQMANMEELSWEGACPDLSHCLNLKKLHLIRNHVSIKFGRWASGTDESWQCPLPPLPSLEELWISGGYLVDTDFLLKFPRLKRLYLSCDFSDLPQNIERLEHLEEVDIFAAHEIAELPKRLTALPSLKRLWINWGVSPGATVSTSAYPAAVNWSRELDGTL